MTEKEKEAIVKLKHYANITAYWKQEEFTNSEIDYYIKLVINYIEKLQKENEEKTTILMAGADKVKQLEKENTDLKRCIDVQKIMRKDMPKDTKLILMYSEDYKRIFKEE